MREKSNSDIRIGGRMPIYTITGNIFSEALEN